MEEVNKLSAKTIEEFFGKYIKENNFPKKILLENLDNKLTRLSKLEKDINNKFNSINTIIKTKKDDTIKLKSKIDQTIANLKYSLNNQA